jgi:hypothetical protein
MGNLSGVTRSLSARLRGSQHHSDCKKPLGLPVLARLTTSGRDRYILYIPPLMVEAVSRGFAPRRPHGKIHATGKLPPLAMSLFLAYFLAYFPAYSLAYFHQLQPRSIKEWHA